MAESFSRSSAFAESRSPGDTTPSSPPPHPQPRHQHLRPPPDACARAPSPRAATPTPTTATSHAGLPECTRCGFAPPCRKTNVGGEEISACFGPPASANGEEAIRPPFHGVLGGPFSLPTVLGVRGLWLRRGQER
ncbi:PREDICTED: interferon regulatory factor 2-binding protein-like B [Ceratotherium simum simum]|uniref:Interferon regulatory factor 2-binding protein-like B n=1 Tax=Ceratotherium simum simum TaxID=73337 RepID=A0ABM1DLF1_CERSS|nr:PREDICTED: interferon regulatory factor 2-binding protein-like B [Ceratotherium simum simum]